MKSVIRAILTVVLLAVLTFGSALAIAPIIDMAAVTGSDINVSSSADVATDMASYTIDELNLTLSIPSDLIVFKRPIAPDDPNLEYFALRQEWLDGYFKEHGIYLDAISKNVNHEILVSMQTSPDIGEMNDFSTVTDDELQSFIEQYADLYERSDSTYLSSEIYRNADEAYIKSYSEYYDDNKTVYALNYYTITDGKAINIFLYSYGLPVSPEQEILIKATVDSAQLPKTPAPIEPSPSPSEAAASPSLVSPSPASPAVSSSPSVSEPTVPANPNTATNTSSQGPNLNIKLILFYLAVTLAVVTLPVAVYRYFIRRYPVTKKASVIISLVYGTICCIAAAVYSHFTEHYYLIIGVILWSIVNYFILSSGRDYYYPDATPPTKSDKPALGKKGNRSELSDIIRSKQCKKCLAVNLADSEECFYCGAKLDDEEPVSSSTPKTE